MYGTLKYNIILVCAYSINEFYEIMHHPWHGGTSVREDGAPRGATAASEAVSKKYDWYKRHFCCGSLEISAATSKMRETHIERVYNRAAKLKTDANFLYESGKTLAALNTYEAARAMIDKDPRISMYNPSDSAAVQTAMTLIRGLREGCLLNAAACFNRLEEWQKSISLCTKVLSSCSEWQPAGTDVGLHFIHGTMSIRNAS